jgi:aquaporin Z
MNLGKRTAAEALGTFWLVFCGCGAAVLAARFQPGGIGLLGVALAFGLGVLTMAYAVGHISGGHFNPAVTVGLWAARRFPSREVLPYVAAQVAGAIIAALVLLLIAQGQPGFTTANGFATNGYGLHSPGGFSGFSAFVTEFVMTALFLAIILGATRDDAPKGFGPLAIGLTLTLTNLVAIPVTNASINPARSTGPAIVAGGWALAQLWMFWLAPILGGAVAGLVYGALRRGIEVPERREARVS